MMGEMFFVFENRAEHARSRLGLDRAMKFADEIRGGEMNFSSLVSALGLTVAALAVHMDEADETAERSSGASVATSRTPDRSR